MPKGTKVVKAENALKKSASRRGVRNKDAYVYGTLNKLGLKKGNKTTAKGRAKASKR